MGKTGSGKSYAARLLTKNIQRLVVLDPKGTLSAGSGWNLTQWDGSTERALQNGEPVRARIQAPLDGNWEPFLETIYHSENVTVYIDEMYGVIQSASKPGQWLTALYTRGRELKIGVWTSTQRPTWIPLFTLSEADWLFVFRLQMETDRARMASLMGAVVADKELKGNNVWVYNQEWPRPMLYKRLKG